MRLSEGRVTRKCQSRARSGHLAVEREGDPPGGFGCDISLNHPARVVNFVGRRGVFRVHDGCLSRMDAPAMNPNRRKRPAMVRKAPHSPKSAFGSAYSRRSHFIGRSTLDLPGPQRVAGRRFDPDDLGAEIHEKLCERIVCHQTGLIQYTYAGQRPEELFAQFRLRRQFDPHASILLRQRKSDDASNLGNIYYLLAALVLNLRN